MSVATKLLGFGGLLAVVFALFLGVGHAVGPVAPAPASHADMAGGHEGKDMGAEGTGASFPKGLLVSQDGYTFRLAQASAPAGTGVPVAFTIESPEGTPVTDYDVEHDKELHLIAVRRDLSGFQHVHPVRDADGTWTTNLDLTSGQWRLFADFKASGAEALTLGTDLAVAGSYEPAPAATNDVRTATVDGYTVTLAGDLTAGQDAKLTLTVTRDGKPVTDLQPYLGAYGHLVALRDGDLAYLHVHPEGAPGDGTTAPGPDVTFFADVPSGGRYHLYLDFKHGDVVRTAAFTVTAAGTGAPDTMPAGESGDGHDGH
jgi:hypothetical protein